MSKRVGKRHLADANLEAPHRHFCRQRQRPAILIDHLVRQPDDLVNLAARKIRHRCSGWGCAPRRDLSRPPVPAPERCRVRRRSQSRRSGRCCSASWAAVDSRDRASLPQRLWSRNRRSGCSLPRRASENARASGRCCWPAPKPSSARFRVRRHGQDCGVASASRRGVGCGRRRSCFAASGWICGAVTAAAAARAPKADRRPTCPAAAGASAQSSSQHGGREEDGLERRMGIE